MRGLNIVTLDREKVQLSPVLIQHGVSDFFGSVKGYAVSPRAIVPQYGIGVSDHQVPE